MPKVEKLEWGAPTNGDWEGLATVITWATKCGRYKVSRIDGVEPRFASIVKTPGGGIKEKFIQNDMTNLGTAFVSVEKYHRKLLGCDAVESNYEGVLKEAEEAGLDRKPKGKWHDVAAEERLKQLRERKKKEEEFEVNEQEAREMLAAVGYGSSFEFASDKIRYKLNRLDVNENSLKIPKEDQHKSLLEDCLQALAKGRRIVLKGSVSSKKTSKEGASPSQSVSDPGQVVTTEAVNGDLLQQSTEVLMLTMKEVDARKLLGAAGYARAGRWPVKTLVMRLAQLPKRPDRMKLLAEKGDLIEDTFKLLSAGAKVHIEEEKGSREEEEKPKEKRPGVLQTILDAMRAGTKDSPVPKDKIMSALTKAFPDRDPKGLASSLSQASYDLSRKGIKVERNDSGYWVV